MTDTQTPDNAADYDEMIRNDEHLQSLGHRGIRVTRVGRMNVKVEYVDPKTGDAFDISRICQRVSVVHGHGEVSRVEIETRQQDVREDQLVLYHNIFDDEKQEITVLVQTAQGRVNIAPGLVEVQEIAGPGVVSYKLIGFAQDDTCEADTPV
jgi:hypothetical protein